ncbi:Spt5-NGN domain-containing protein/Spt5_N domain-containing protein, partial [Cephalotus follicularis]
YSASKICTPLTETRISILTPLFQGLPISHYSNPHKDCSLSLSPHIQFDHWTMPRPRDDDEDEMEDEEEEYEQVLEDEEEDEEPTRAAAGSAHKRRRSDFIDDAAEEDDEEEEEEDDEDEDYGGGRRRQKPKRRSGSQFFDLEAQVNSDEEEEEEEGEDDFIVDNVADLPEEDGGRRFNRRPFVRPEDEQEDVEALERKILERYTRSSHTDYDEEPTDVEQQALLPSVRDPKLWMVKCAIGREREAAVCLMQKCIDKGSELQIRSAVALDHLKNYIYIEADKEAHVTEACKGLRVLFTQKIMLVPIKEMADVLSVESKSVDLSRDTWVRMKIGTHKNDLAKVVDVDNVRQRVTVKLIPRIDLQALANKLEGREVPKKKQFVPPPRFMNVDEARELHIRVERRRDPMTGDYFENIGGMLFKDGFLYKNVSMKSISSHNIKPTFDELEKFRQPGENGEGDIASLSTLFANRKKGHFMKGDAVIIVKGDLKNLKGWVEKVEEENVHIRPEMKGLPKTLAVNERELCKYFEPGNHVKVVSGTQQGATGMVVKVEQHVLIILSDTTKEHIRVFADDVVESSEVTTGITKIGDYELHDLVQLDNNSFGVIIRVESEAFQVLKGVPERPEVALVKLREIKCKLEKKHNNVNDRYQNQVSVKDVVRILDGPCKGKQGPVEHIHRGVLFIYDRHHLEHAGFICSKASSCIVIGGSRSNGNRNGDSYSRFSSLKTPPRIPASPGRFSRGGPPFVSGGRHRGGRGGHDALVGTTIKVRLGPFKGYRGRVVDVKGNSVRVELESQMKVVTVDRNSISDNVVVSTPYRDTPRYGMGSETPMHPSRTPLHPYMTPMRDAGATPIHDGMRTPMRDRAWNPYAPMSPPRDNWEDGNPASWGTSPQYQPGSPPSRAYEAPTPGSNWANTPGGNYSEAGTPRDSSSAYANAPSPYLPSTPGGQPMTPNSGSYLPGTPGGQPMTPGTGGLDVMSPVIGGDNDGPWFMPDILVSLRRSGDESMGVIREVLPDGSCRVVLESSGSGETVTALSNEMEIVIPKKSDKIKIMGGSQRGATGKLIGVDGTDGIVKLDDTLDVKILDMELLAKVAQP